MKRKAEAILLEIGTEYKGKGNYEELKEYLMPVLKSVTMQDPQVAEKVSRHLVKANTVLKREAENVANNMKTIFSQLDHECLEDFDLPKPNPAIIESIRIIKFLSEEITRLNREILNDRAHTLDEQHQLMEGMIDMTQFLIDNKKEVTVRIQRVINPRERTIFMMGKKNQIKLSQLRRVVNTHYTIVSFAPPPFRSSTKNRIFFDNLIDKSVRKPETTYFSELPEEMDLEYFLGMEERSPLAKEGIIPYNYDTTPDAVKEWIDLATVALAEFDITEDEDRAATIAIFCHRYLFNSTYPLLYPPNSPTKDSLNKKMEKFRNRTPRDIGILLKYVPSELVDEPCYKIFEYDDLAKEAVQWMREAEFQLTPIDAAWCIVKAHESLSIMCVKREMVNKGKTSYTSEEYAEKMPGFDDIFEMWRAFLSSCDLGDPRQLLNFINDYSHLPGFTARILASIAYFEASVGQLEAESE